METDLQQIASFESAFQAEQTRSVLQEHNIPAVVDGANANTAMSYVGSALGGVRLLVRASDVAAASEILEALAAEREETGTPWFCGKCQEEVDAGFECCWSCGSARAEVERPFPFSQQIYPEPREVSEEQGNYEGPRAPLSQQSNPYASPHAPTSHAAESYDEAHARAEAEATLQRAWRASLIGLVLFPPVLHLYSMYLLIRAATLASEFSVAGRRRYYAAFILNVVAGVIWGLVWTRLLSPGAY